MIYISDRLKTRLDVCFNIDFNDAKIIAIAKGQNYDRYCRTLYDNQIYMHILYYINNKFLRLAVDKDNRRLYASFMEKTDRKRKDYDADKDRYSFYGQEYEDGYLEYEENVLYLTEYNDEYMYIRPYRNESYKIKYHDATVILKNRKDDPLFNFSDVFVLYKLGGVEAYEALIEEKFDYKIKF